MSNQPPPVLCGDSNTWHHNAQKIDLPRLLQLIEENGGPEGLDLHGCDMRGIDARPEALLPHIEAYALKQAPDAAPPWLGTGRWHGIQLAGAHLEHANLSGAHLENAFLSAAQLQNAHLSGAHLESALLSGAHLENAFLLDTHVESAFLPGAHLENASLRSAHLENAHLIGAHLQNASLNNAHLQNADLREAHLHAVMWYCAHLDRTYMGHAQLGQAVGDELAAQGQTTASGRFSYAREAYLGLKTNFDSIGRYEDANWAFVKERQMEKAMYFPTTAGHGWIRDRMAGAVPPPWWPPRCLPRWIRWKLRSTFYHTRLFFPFPGLCPRELREQMARRSQDEEAWHEWLNRPRWLRNWFYEATCGYGENPWRPLICAAVVVLLFAAIYAAAGNIASGDVGALEGQPTHSPITALVHSISAFATIGFNTLEPQGWGARLLTAMEAMLGIGLFALFVFTLANRMRRS